MCGACGTTVHPDAVMGDEHTQRKRMLVAQTVTAVCAGLPGTPRIAALAAGWSVTSATGSMALCPTVADVWLALLSRSGPNFHQAIDARALVEDPDGLAAQVLALGQHLARQRPLAGAQYGTASLVRVIRDYAAPS
ncbi:hypothetical protein SAMN05216368_10555 [Cryobacterium flavum]|uniref:Uncharacterized protein n=2 Tax=Cryobacterium flavum TaxID=1424659 RepID=A0A5E9FYE9_9MICO|nr:hypothetical protein SAMN05216368_10555 [Cryobacterium flavum]